MRFSILLATLGRTQELSQFFSCLSAQTWSDFEVVVIDQNPDDRLVGLLAQYSAKFQLRHIRSPRGHSRAFNIGLAYAMGDIVAFPDDDCWYDPDLLERVVHFFQNNPNCSGLSGREVVESGFSSGGRWSRRAGPITQHNVWRRAITFSIFLRQSIVQNTYFDESLGVGAGTAWGAGEETDYLLRAVEQGHSIHYDPSLVIWHQGRSGPYNADVFSKARSYGMGVGRVLRKHRYPVHSVAYHLLRPLGGTLLSLGAGRFGKARYHWSIFAGRTSGWMASHDASVSTQASQLISGSEADFR
jgi:glycosyltransferase involved in cell wall biosynthesis